MYISFKKKSQAQAQAQTQEQAQAQARASLPASSSRPILESGTVSQAQYLILNEIWPSTHKHVWKGGFQQKLINLTLKTIIFDIYTVLVWAKFI